MQTMQLRYLLAVLVGVSLGTSSWSLAQTPAVRLAGGGQSVHLQANGSLNGQAAFPTQDGGSFAVASSGQLSLVRDGKVVETAAIQSDGNFSFPSVQPGTYSVIGQGANSSLTGVGATSIDVLPYDAAVTGNPLQMGIVPMGDVNLLASLQGINAPAVAAAGSATGMAGAAGAAGGAGGAGMGMLGGIMGAALGGLGAGLGNSGNGGSTSSGGGSPVSSSTP